VSPSKKKKDPDPEVYKYIPRIVINKSGNMLPYKPRLLNRDCSNARAISIRSSTRWIDAFKTPNGGLNVPFIDDLGRFTGLSAYRWSCDPRSLIATTTSTICSRLLKYCRKHNDPKVVKKRLHDLMEASAYYAFTKNAYFWDRILFFSRNLERYKKPLRSLRIFFTSKWDDQKRFVYSHVTFQTQWLLFRALLPRDKSLFNTFKRKTWSNPSRWPDKSLVTNCIREISYEISMV
jgi:hypothetical protein